MRKDKKPIIISDKRELEKSIDMVRAPLAIRQDQEKVKVQKPVEQTHAMEE